MSDQPTRSKNDLFGIFIRGNHAFGALLTPATDPKTHRAALDPATKRPVYDFEAFDFDGKTIRRHEISKFNAELTFEHFERAEEGILFPVSKETTAQMRRELDDLERLLHSRYVNADEVERSHNPHYFEEYNGIVNACETKGKHPIDYLGNDRTDIPSGLDLDAFGEPSDSFQRSGTNCLRWELDTLQHVGGVPIDALLPDCPEKLHSISTVADFKRALESYLDERSAQSTADYDPRNSRADCGALIKGEHGEYAYAYRGFSSAINHLIPTLPLQQIDGEEVDIAELLGNRSEPFLDETLKQPEKTPVARKLASKPHVIDDAELEEVRSRPKAMQFHVTPDDVGGGNGGRFA